MTRNGVVSVVACIGRYEFAERACHRMTLANTPNRGSERGGRVGRLSKGRGAIVLRMMHRPATVLSRNE